MSFLKKLFANYILLSAVCIILGVALIIDPGFFTNAISYTIGGLFAAAGVGYVIRYFTRGEEKSGFLSELIKGILLAAVGIFLILRPDFIFKIFAIAFGLYMVFSGFVSLGDALDIRKGGGGFVFPLVLAILTTVLGLVIVFNPLMSKDIAVQILGITLAVSGVSNLIGCLSGRHMLKSVAKELKKAANRSDDDVIDV